MVNLSEQFKCDKCAAIQRTNAKTRPARRCECGGRFQPFEQKNKRAEPRAGRPGSGSAQRSAPFESPRSSGAVPEGHEGARARAPRMIDVCAADVKPGDDMIDPPTGCELRVLFVEKIAARCVTKPGATHLIGYERKGGAPIGYFATPTEVLRVKGPQ